MMRTYCLAIMLPIMMVSLTVTDHPTYSAYVTVKNPSGFTHFLAPTNMTFSMLYGNTSNLASVYTPTWKPLDIQYFDFSLKPNSQVTYFFSKSKQHNFLFGDNQGHVMKKFLVVNGSITVMLWQIKQENNHVEKVVVSPDQTTVAAFCQNSENVYLMDAEILFDLKKVLNYTGPVSSIAWRDQTNQLGIAGGDTKIQTYFLLYDYDLQTETDLTFLTDQLVLDFTFSPDGNTIYFIEETKTTNDDVVKIYDFVTEETSTLNAPGADNQFSGVSLRGNFVSAWDGLNVFVWNRLTTEFIGKYSSKLTTNGLSTDGNYLTTVALGAFPSINVLSNCEVASLYDPGTDSCIKCQPPCNQCFLKQDQCSTCVTGYYPIQGYTCQLCSNQMIGCTACSNSTFCTTCNEKQHWILYNNQCRCQVGYFKLNDNCSHCIDHCWQCDATDTCQVCDLFQHWVMKNDQCVCLDTYYQSNNQCLACYEGCYACQSGKTCEQCYTSRDWEMRDGKCQCKVDYVPVYSVCFSCWNLISNCQSCSSSTTCTQCQEGYQLDGSNYCVEKESSHVVIFVVVGAAVVVLAIGGFFLWRYLKNKKHNRSLLETEAYTDQ